MEAALRLSANESIASLFADYICASSETIFAERTYLQHIVEHH